MPSRLIFAPGAFSGGRTARLWGSVPGGFITMDPGSAPSLALSILAPASESAIDDELVAIARGEVRGLLRENLDVDAGHREQPGSAPPRRTSKRSGRRLSGGTRAKLTRATHTPMPRRHGARGDVREQRVLVRDGCPHREAQGNNRRSGVGVGGKPRGLGRRAPRRRKRSRRRAAPSPRARAPRTRGGWREPRRWPGTAAATR